MDIKNHLESSFSYPGVIAAAFIHSNGETVLFRDENCLDLLENSVKLQKVSETEITVYLKDKVIQISENHQNYVVLLIEVGSPITKSIRRSVRRFWQRYNSGKMPTKNLAVIKTYTEIQTEAVS